MAFAYILRITVLFVLYYITARLGLLMDAVSGFASLVWPPTGIAVAALLLYGYRLWPGIALGAFIVNYLNGAPLFSAWGISFGNTLEALLAAYVLNRYTDFHKSLERVKDVALFIAIAAVSSTLVSASIGVTSLWLGNIITTDHFLPAWRTWWLGDLYGCLIVAPLILVWVAGKKVKLTRSQVFEAGSLLALLSLLSLTLFGCFNKGLTYPNLPLLFIFFPFIIWASLRFAQIGNVTVALILSGFAIWGATNGIGLFAERSLMENLFLLNTYIGVLAVTGLVLAASASERKKAIQIRDEFISIASHELKSPLALLSLQLQSLRKTSDPQKFVPKVQACEKQAERMGRLLDDLMDLTQIRIGKLDLEKETFDLFELVKTTTERFSLPTAPAEKVITIQAAPPIIGNWDRSRLEQVVTNLISNACKYGNGAPIEIGMEVDSNRRIVRLEVRDQGIGIPQNMQTDIFECFKRAPSAALTKGLGLGLYIVRQLVEAHAGTVWVTSTQGVGSTFTVELPIT